MSFKIRRWRVGTMSRTWKLRQGKVLVVEDASTASLVIVARDLVDRKDKIATLEEVLREMRSTTTPGELSGKRP
jgi:hypothetical protein